MITLNLGGQWTLNKKDSNEYIPAAVPGDVYADLLAAGQIPDPFYRDNEEQLQWIGKTDWQYSREFELTEDILNSQKVLLVCKGLDTFAQITINGTKIASTDNMFRQWQWDVTNLLAPKNKIEITFNSTIPYIERHQAQRPLPHWASNSAGAFGWVRKQQCNYGWDWGIKAVTCGIWRDIKLEAFSFAKIQDIEITQDHSAKNIVSLDINVLAQVICEKPATARVSVELSGARCCVKSCPLDGSGAANLRLDIENPQLWWPNNMGGQPLYTVKITLTDENGELLDETVKKIGLRTLRLDRTDDRWGQSFRFVVNGVPFFAKGANWIPADAILARVSPQKYRRLLEDAAAVNMNMIRVWGGGIYENDVFYDICDELGLCVWQDFMFACSTYPTYNDDFTANIEEEARCNIKRLRHHPCIALWCGNNELEQGLVGDEWTAKTMSWKDYSRVFDKLLPSLITELDPCRDYWPGSPHSPVGNRSDFNNPDCGDAHLWSVWHGKMPFEWYRTCRHRFNSEFGFQSFPEPKTVYGYTAPQDRNITSWVMEHHQRSGIGNTTIMQYMLDWFLLPLGFENTLWVSQILQAMAMKYACEHWRRSMPRGMGTLYWQINDTWPVASWSSIDYHGRWKALHYMARKFFAPLLISGVEDIENAKVEIHTTSDLQNEKEAAVKWFVTDTQGQMLTSGKKDVTIPPLASGLTHTLDLAGIIAQKGVRNIIVWLELESEGQKISDNMVLFARPKHLTLSSHPEIRTEVIRSSDTDFDVAVSAQKPALWCRIGLKDIDAVYSDNFVHIRPQEKVTIRVKTQQPLTKEQFASCLEVQSISQTV